MVKFKKTGIIIVVTFVTIIGTIFITRNNNKEYNSLNTQIAFYYIDSGNETKTDKIPDG